MTRWFFTLICIIAMIATLAGLITHDPKLTSIAGACAFAFGGWSIAMTVARNGRADR